MDCESAIWDLRAAFDQLLNIGTRGREADRRGEQAERIWYPRSSAARRESFALLTKTYHGSRVIGKWVFRRLPSEKLVAGQVSQNIGTRPLIRSDQPC